MSRKCLICGKEFKVYPSTEKTAKYCSRSCQGKGVLGQAIRTEEWKRKISLALKGKKHSLEHIENWRKTAIGRKQSPEQIAKRVAKNTGQKRTAEFRFNRSKEKCHLWRGGITEINILIRSQREYKDWRKSVFERDNYTCQSCYKRGGEMQADHIKQFAYHPELRLDLNNGRTLCLDCHRKTETFGRSL